MQSPQRLLSIDALRGAAAIGVVLYHTNGIPGVDRSLLWGDALDSLMFLGKWGVWLFFVISGFCIHMQWVRAQVVPGARPLEFGDFWRRRIRRLYPPYLVTLVFYVWIRFADGSLQWDGLSAWKIFLHLFMLQNLDPQALAAMNNVYWTLAVEEQLYLLYFAFLAVRQRWGWGAALGLAAGARLGWFVLAFALNRAFDIQIVVTQAAMTQWVVWVLGALSVEAAWGLVRLPAAARNISIGGAIMGLASLLVWAQNYWLGPGLLNDVIWLTADVVWGASFFVLVNWAVTRERETAGRALPRGVLWLAGAGLFSYSLYLTHEIVEWRLWPPVAESMVAAGYALPHIVVASGLLAVCLLFGWVFFLFFEKPFLSRSRIAVSGLASAVAR